MKLAEESQIEDDIDHPLSPPSPQHSQDSSDICEANEELTPSLIEERFETIFSIPRQFSTPSSEFVMQTQRKINKGKIQMNSFPFLRWYFVDSDDGWKLKN